MKLLIPAALAAAFIALPASPSVTAAQAEWAPDHWQDLHTAFGPGRYKHRTYRTHRKNPLFKRSKHRKRRIARHRRSGVRYR